MSISCQFMAEGAVRLPSSRLTPKPAHSRLDSTWSGSLAVSNSRDEWRMFNTCMSGLPPSV